MPGRLHIISICLAGGVVLAGYGEIKGGGLSATLAGVSRLAPRDFTVKLRSHHCEGLEAFWSLRVLHGPKYALHGAA